MHNCKNVVVADAVAHILQHNCKNTLVNFDIAQCDTVDSIVNCIRPILEGMPRLRYLGVDDVFTQHEVNALCGAYPEVSLTFHTRGDFADVDIGGDYVKGEYEYEEDGEYAQDEERKLQRIKFSGGDGYDSDNDRLSDYSEGGEHSRSRDEADEAMYDDMELYGEIVNGHCRRGGRYGEW